MLTTTEGLLVEAKGKAISPIGWSGRPKCRIGRNRSVLAEGIHHSDRRMEIGGLALVACLTGIGHQAIIAGGQHRGQFKTSLADTLYQVNTGLDLGCGRVEQFHITHFA